MNSLTNTKRGMWSRLGPLGKDVIMRAKDAFITTISKPPTAALVSKPKAELWRRVQDAGIVAKSWVSDFTGYEAIETLKVQESSHHAAFVQAKENLKDLQGAYAKAVDTRSRAQMQLNSLLNRRLEWTSKDTTLFAELNEEEILMKMKEVSAQKALEDCMELMNSSQTHWLRAVEQHRKQELAYIENSRQLGTYASLALLSLNMVLFAANFLVLEPYKDRRRLKCFQEVVTAQGDELAKRFEASGHYQSRDSSRDGRDSSDDAAAASSAVVTELQEQLQQSEQRIMTRLSDVLKEVQQQQQQQHQHKQLKKGFFVAAGRKQPNSEDGGDSSVGLTSEQQALAIKQQKMQMAGLACLAGVASSALCMIVMVLIKGGER